MMSPQTRPALATNYQTKNTLIGSVQRALRILELLAQHPAGLNAKQVNQRLQLNLSTCYHLLNTLIASGYVVKDPDTLLFRLSSKIGYRLLHPVAPAQLAPQLTPHVQALQEATQETAYLSLWDGQEIFLAVIAESPRSVRVKALTIGYSQANHAMALGKAILAQLDQPQLERYLAEHELTAYTSHTLTDPAGLKVHLSEVRQQGYSLDLEEFLPEVCCIGAPIFDAQEQVIASIAISLPSTRYQVSGHCLLTPVSQAAQAATRTLAILGYVQPALANLER